MGSRLAGSPQCHLRKTVSSEEKRQADGTAKIGVAFFLQNVACQVRGILRLFFFGTEYKRSVAHGRTRPNEAVQVSHRCDSRLYRCLAARRQVNEPFIEQEFAADLYRLESSKHE
jgi:hypothetical protein